MALQGVVRPELTGYDVPVLISGRYINSDHGLKHCDFNRTQDKEALGLNIYMRFVSDERSP